MASAFLDAPTCADVVSVSSILIKGARVLTMDATGTELLSRRVQNDEAELVALIDEVLSFSDELVVWADKARAANKHAVPPPTKNILVISGGGVFGAYPAGVLYGWAERSSRRPP